MQHLSRSAPKKFTSFYYGWVIVALAGLGVFFSGPGQTYSVSVFINSYIEDFGWTRSLVSGIYSFATLSAGLLLFIIGRLVDRFGQRVMMAGVGLMLAVACFWNSVVIGPIMLFVGFFMLRLFGQGSMTLVPNTLVPQWFIQKRGRAMSVMLVGTFVSSAAFPPLSAWMIDTWGWPVAWRVWGVLLCVIFVPLVLLFVRNRPEDIGLLPDNASNLRGSEKEGPETQLYEENWTLKEATRTRSFWLVLLCVAIPAMVNTGVTFHLVSILGRKGIEPTTAAFVLSLMAIVGFPMTFFAGYVVDRFKVHRVLGWSFIGQLGFLILLIFVHSVTMAMVFGVIWGLVNGMERITLNVVWPDYFGRKHLGSIKGFATTFIVIGSAFGPLPFGVAFDLFHGYTEILIVMMIFPIIGCISAFISPPPERNS
ncbi:MAG TPA: MFS transporter [Bacillales bacterium]|nr:MFS transporter [Bacillales bacterium]